MPTFQRSASSTWRGDLKSGAGVASSQSGTLADVAITVPSRFDNAGGCNPEELIAAAHAACYSMFLSAILSGAGHVPDSIATTSVVTLVSGGEGGPKITRVDVTTEGRVPGIDDATFQKFAADAKVGCPVSKLLLPGLEEMTLTATFLA